jgi:HAT1-interacting factor 1
MSLPSPVPSNLVRLTPKPPQLVELRQSPVSINDSNPLSGILGSMLGESPAVQKSRLEEASKEANDLTGLVKRKKASNAPSPQPPATEAPKTNGKRKVEFDEETVEVGTGKKAKLEDGSEE